MNLNHIFFGERQSCMSIDLEPNIKGEDVQQLSKECTRVFVGGQFREFANSDNLMILDERVEISPRWQLCLQIDQEL